jgi:hypothetical protein
VLHFSHDLHYRETIVVIPFRPILFAAGLFWVMVTRVASSPPEVSFLVPDFATENPSVTPHIITGEEFQPGKTEVWVLDGPKDSSEATNAVASLGDADPLLPTEPPQGARRVLPLDVERQVIVAALEGFAAWVRTPAGTSTPHAVNLPKPFWISRHQAEPGEVLHLFGFGLRAPYRECFLALVSTTRHHLIRPFAPSRDYRAQDSTLVYFELPQDAAPGKYQLFVHNGYGGALGWRIGGVLEVTPKVAITERLFDIRTYGAKGDDEENDYAAITNAMAAAKTAIASGIRPVVYFPPGKWRTDTTLEIPSRITLRGSSPELSLIEGFCTTPTDRTVTALVQPASETALEKLTIQGSTRKGPNSYWLGMITTPPPKVVDGEADPVQGFTLRNCRLKAGDSLSSEPRFNYRYSLFIPRFKNIQVFDNDFFGAITMGSASLPSYRLEFVANSIHGGGNADNVSLNIYQLFESVVDSTQLRDAASRCLLNARQHCAIRLNEVHDYSRAIWANAEETFLVHGNTSKSGGQVSTAEATTLTDTSKRWAPNFWRNSEVLIIGGRGFGQHRAVEGNAADQLTIRQPWRVIPDATSKYIVGHYFVENSWYANLNDTPGRMSLWLECIGNIVEKHRDVFSGGVDIWGQDRTTSAGNVSQGSDHRFMPSWYNIIHDCWFDGSMLKLWSNLPKGNSFGAPALFGTFVAGNRLRQSHMVRTGFEKSPRIDAAIWVGHRSGADMTQAVTNLCAISHTIIAGNFISHTPRGISVSDLATKTFMVGNSFESVEKPILDWGTSTFQKGNLFSDLTEQGEKTRQTSPDQ